MPNICNYKSLLILHKRRFFYKHCNKSFIAEANLVYKNKNISSKMKQAFRLHKGSVKYIENSFKYGINNGRTRGTNNLIKAINRIAFGYRKYNHFISRIFLIKGIIKE
ncbi:MAG: transposase [Bacilli bacterium]|nr:transposase [Bacilli bacterium]